MSKKSKSKTPILDAVINELADKGLQLIEKAYNNRQWNNQTYNLHDSYCSCVYVNNQYVSESIRYLGEPLANQYPKGKYSNNRTFKGRDWAMEAIKEYKPNDKGIHLVIFASIPYAGYVEISRNRYVIYNVINDAMELGSVEKIKDNWSNFEDSESFLEDE